MGAVGEDVLARRSGEKASSGPGLPGPLTFVVGVKAKVEGVVEYTVSGQALRKDKGLEEPRHMREVPFGRARVFHRLDGHVLGRQRERQIPGKVACVEQAVLQNPFAVDGGALE